MIDRSLSIGKVVPDHEEQVPVETSVREDATRKSETLEEMGEEVVAPRKIIEELKVRAERDAQMAEAARLAAGERVEAAAKGAASTKPTSGQGAHSDDNIIQESCVSTSGVNLA